MEVSVYIDDAFEAEIDAEQIKTAVLQTVEAFDEAMAADPNRSVTLTITDDETVQQLNFQYLGLNVPTDVLSFENVPDADFPAVEAAMMDHLGDIVIAFPVAKTQARVAGHTSQEEVVLLTVHGTLHLLGFDHDTDENKEKMWAAQQQVMRDLDLMHVQPTED